MTTKLFEIINNDILLDIFSFLCASSLRCVMLKTSTKIFNRIRNKKIVVNLVNSGDMKEFDVIRNTVFNVNITFFSDILPLCVLYNLNKVVGLSQKVGHLMTQERILSVDYSNSNIDDVYPFEDIPVVILKNCENLKHVHPLSKCHTVILHGCKKVTDVSSLCDVHTLDIRGTSVVDISKLGGVKNLIR